MTRCMGNRKTEDRCQQCKRLPQTVKGEDAEGDWVDPAISTKKICPEFLEGVNKT